MGLPAASMPDCGQTQEDPPEEGRGAGQQVVAVRPSNPRGLNLGLTSGPAIPGRGHRAGLVPSLLPGAWSQAGPLALHWFPHSHLAWRGEPGTKDGSLMVVGY